MLMTIGCASWRTFFEFNEGPEGEESVVEILPLPSLTGSAEIVVVKEEDRFVIINFRADPVPKVGDQINVYRDDKKVARLRITEPVRDSFSAADIEEGEPRVGDKVK